MGKRSVPITTAVMAIALLAGTGCVSKKMFRANVDDTDRRIGGVENAVEANQRRVEDLDKETGQQIASVDGKAAQAMGVGSQAMSKAEAAAKAAQGKLLWDVTLSNDLVKFDLGKANLSKTAVAALDELIGKVKTYGKALYIEVEGHTDSAGTETLNERLGSQRASAVRSYLNEKGIPLHAINTISYGESRPVADNSSKSGRSQNRRVVIRVLE